ncbi:unnamed protein product, partial [Prorocentrum cordatum]
GRAKGDAAIVWRQLARACWRQDWRLALLVVAQNERARALAHVEEASKSVSILDIAEFQRRHNFAQQEGVAPLRHSLEDAAGLGPEEEQAMQLVARRCLATLEVDGCEPTETSDINLALGQNWGQVFCPVTPTAASQLRKRDQSKYPEPFGAPVLDGNGFPAPRPKCPRE